MGKEIQVQNAFNIKEIREFLLFNIKHAYREITLPHRNNMAQWKDGNYIHICMLFPLLKHAQLSFACRTFVLNANLTSHQSLVLLQKAADLLQCWNVADAMSRAKYPNYLIIATHKHGWLPHTAPHQRCSHKSTASQAQCY